MNASAPEPKDTAAPPERPSLHGGPGIRALRDADLMAPIDVRAALQTWQELQARFFAVDRAAAFVRPPTEEEARAYQLADVASSAAMMYAEAVLEASALRYAMRALVCAGAVPADVLRTLDAR